MTEKKKANIIGQLLRNRREAMGFTQKDLARLLEIEYYTMISNMELGHMAVPPRLWVPLALALNMDRNEWSLRCLREIQPDVYEAIFDHKSIKEVSSIVKGLGREGSS